MVDVDSFYARSHVLHAISLSVPDRQIFAVLGRNGIGKTTLLRTLMGLTDRSSGQIRLRHRDRRRADAQAGARGDPLRSAGPRDLSRVHRAPEHSDGLLCVQGRQARDSRPHRDAVSSLMANLDRPGGLLSGGQQQQLAIVRALAAKPSILLMDEPTEGIQPNIVVEIEEIIPAPQPRGAHHRPRRADIAFARRAGHSFAMLEKGRVAACGTAADLTDDLIHRHLAV